MKTPLPSLRSRTRQHAEVQFARVQHRTVGQSKAELAVRPPVTLDIDSLADLKETVRRGLRGFVCRPEIAAKHKA
jgi:hypothetical protein